MRASFVRPLLQHRRALIVTAYVVLIVLGFVMALWLRYDFRPPVASYPVYAAALALLVASRLFANARAGLFHGYWQHFGLADLLSTLRAVTLGSVGFVAALVVTGLWPSIPVAVIVLEWLLAGALAGGVHFVARCVRDGHIRLRARAGQRTLVVGAGDAAERLIRQARHESSLGINPVCLVDDDPEKIGLRLHGLRVEGDLSQIGLVVKRYGVELIVVAIPSARPERLRGIVRDCLATGVKFKILQPLRQMLDARSDGAAAPLRDVRLEDLLGRPPVALDLTPVAADLTGRVVLITGGAGSIGAEIARQVARLAPARLVLYDQAESPLYFIDQELRRAHPELALESVVASITNPLRLQQVFSHCRPEVVFHAAAYKHVPLMEANLIEAIRTNILGTMRVAQAAARWGVCRFVLLSTDKSVRPSSVMGATKHVAEQLVLGLQELRESATEFRVVRFGNVLGSEGSVIPLFRRQLEAGGPLTVTHPDVVRFFMTIPEAVQLVLQAASLREARGRVVILEMGEPVRILDLAENLVRLSGLEPYRDVGIVFTGLRPGEKLREELTTEFEATVPTSIRQLCMVESPIDDAQGLYSALDQLAAAVVGGDSGAALRVLRACVPSCSPPLRDRPIVADRPPSSVAVPVAAKRYVEIVVPRAPLGQLPVADSWPVDARQVRVEHAHGGLDGPPPVVMPPGAPGIGGRPRYDHEVTPGVAGNAAGGHSPSGPTPP